MQIRNGFWLDLAPGALNIYFWYLLIKGGRLFGTGRLFLFWETTKCSKENFNVFWKRNNNRSCNNNKYVYLELWNRVSKHFVIFLNFPCLIACLLRCLLMSFFSLFACFVVRDLCYAWSWIVLSVPRKCVIVWFPHGVDRYVIAWLNCGLAKIFCASHQYCFVGV